MTRTKSAAGTVGALLLLLLAGSQRLGAQAFCSASAGNEVTTDKFYYAQGQTVHVSGTGFAASCKVNVRVRPPEGGSGGETPLRTDTVGSFSYSFVPGTLNGTYVVQIFGLAHALLASTTFVNGPGLATDKGDYHPGETVTMTGARWLAGETVALLVHEVHRRVADRAFSAEVDASGDFVNKELIIALSDVGGEFLLTATGLTSGWTAQTRFTDAGTDVPLRSGTTCIYGSGWSSTLDTVYGSSQVSQALTGATNNFAFYSTPLAASTTLLSGDKAAGDIWVGNVGSSSLTVNVIATVYDYDPSTGAQTQVLQTNTSINGSIGAGSTRHFPLPGGTGLASNYTFVTAHELKAVVTVTVVSGTATDGTLLYNAASGQTGDSIVQVPSNTGRTWTFGGGCPATQLAFGTQPSNTTAGQSISPAVTVQVRDVLGNVVTSSTASVTMAIGTNPGGGTLSGTLTVAAVSGVATFSNLSINKAGTGYTLTASSSGLTGATSSAFNITAGSPNKLNFGTLPSNTTAGQSISPAVTVRIEDAYGNLTTSTANVTVAIGTNPGGGTLSGTLTVAAVAGVATFSNLSINKAGTGYTLTASSSGLTGATSSAFNITAGSPNKLNFGTQPSNTTAGQSISPAVTVRIEDAYGNLTASTANVTVAIGTNPGGGTLSGTLTVAAVAGVATFSNLSINKAGTGYTLTASSSGLTGATSNSFNITVGSPSVLNFGTQPSNTNAGQTISPAVTVRIEDAYGNLTTSTASVTVAIGTNPGGGTLSGTLTVAAVGGVATFSNLSIDLPGNGYTLTASSSGLTGATSSSFNVISTDADLSVTVTDGVTRAFACSTVTYTIVVTNNGPTAVTAATVTDNFPADLTGVTWNCSASSGSSCGAGSGSGNITTTANLLNGGTATYTATGTVARTANGTMSNTASASVPAGITDPNTGNNSAADTDSLNYWVNNATGSDSNPGTSAQPYATLGKAASVIGGSATVFVQVGASRSGTPYAANVTIPGAGQQGSASCPTLFQGIADGNGQLPLVQGSDPTADTGFDVSANYVKVDGFQIANTLVALVAEPTTSGVVFSNNFVQVPDLGYGILLYSSSGSLASNNRVEAAGSGSFYGIWDYDGTGDTIEGNKVSGFGAAGLQSDFSTGLLLRRNIANGNTVGVQMSNAAGTATLYNNTVDSNSYLGIYAESPGGAVTSRNNIVVNNGVGWGWNGVGTVSSNYDDVFGNTSNYTFHGTVAAGANSISSSPSFVQTTDPTLSTYYQLAGGSPCINAGTNVGLPFLGSAPDIGAVETQ